MDRDELAAKNQASRYANSGEVDSADALILPGITGRENDVGADPASESRLDNDQPMGPGLRSAITGVHLSEMGANETTDGLSGTEEAARQAAEDETELDECDELPVFDRAEAMPKII